MEVLLAMLVIGLIFDVKILVVIGFFGIALYLGMTMPPFLALLVLGAFIYFKMSK